MYILDKETNQLITAEPTTFKEQKLKERQHLQEWIVAKCQTPCILHPVALHNEATQQVFYVNR